VNESGFRYCVRNDLSIAKSAMFDFESTSIATRLAIMESSNRDPFIAPFTQ